MAAVAKQILLHVILNERDPGVLGMVANESRLIKRAGINGQILHELGRKGTRQTVRGRAYFQALANAQNYIKSLPAHVAGASRITSVLGTPHNVQGFIHGIQSSAPYAVHARITIKVALTYTYAVDVDIDFTRTI